MTVRAPVFRSFDRFAIEATVGVCFPGLGSLGFESVDDGGFAVALSDPTGKVYHNPDGTRALAVLSGPSAARTRAVHVDCSAHLWIAATTRGFIGAPLSLDQFHALHLTLLALKYSRTIIALDFWRRDGHGFARRPVDTETLFALLTSEGCHLPLLFLRAEKTLLHSRGVRQQ
jgi:hypothetical protein